LASVASSDSNYMTFFKKIHSIISKKLLSLEVDTQDPF